MQASPEEPDRIRRARFAKAVRDALRAFHDPVHLQSSPLIDWLNLRALTDVSSPVALRQILRDAIDALKPAPSIPYGRPEWVGYRVLWERYIQSKSRHLVCQDLNMSQTSYYRAHREALDAIVCLLRDEHQGVTTPDPPIDLNPTPPDGEQVVQAAASLAQKTPSQRVVLGNVLESARQIVAPLFEQKGLMLCIDGDAALAQVDGDPALLRQIVLNILTEAIVYAAGDTLHLSVSRTGRLAECTVGPLTESVAEMCELAATEGVAISRSLLRGYGGSLWFEDGSDARAAFAVPAIEQKVVLMVDDDEDTLSLYTRFLAGEGYVVQAAINAEAVREILARRKPDVILLDVLMPREDGWDILRQLNSEPETGDIPVVVCSVLAQPQLALAMGATRVLHKPIQQEVLLATIGEALATARSAA